MGSERNGVCLTKWKHNTKIKLVYALAIFRKMWLCTLNWVFIMVSFYYDARLMYKIGK